MIGVNTEAESRYAVSTQVADVGLKGMVQTDDDGNLDYASALEDMVRDARVILSRDVRHSILKITPGSAETPAATDA